MKGSGTCNERGSISLNSPVKLSLATSTKRSFTKDGRFVLSKDEYGWAISPRPDSTSFEEDCMIGESAGYLKEFMGRFICCKDFKTLKEVENLIQSIYKDQKDFKFRLEAFNIYRIKENNKFWLYKEGDKVWNISYEGSKHYEVYLNELAELSFSTRFEALKYLEKWFSYHNVQAD